MHWISRDGIRANALFIAAKVSIPSSLSIVHRSCHDPKCPVVFPPCSRLRIHTLLLKNKNSTNISKAWSITLFHQRSALETRRATFCLGDMFTKSKPFSNLLLFCFSL